LRYQLALAEREGKFRRNPDDRAQTELSELNFNRLSGHFFEHFKTAV